MKQVGPPVSILSTVLRFCVATALAIALVLPHFSTAASASGVSKVMGHMSNEHADMNLMPSHHDKANGSLCATICAGANQFSGPEMPLQSFSVRQAFWTVTNDPDWSLCTPDPALRPPDPAFSA